MKWELWAYTLISDVVRFPMKKNAKTTDQVMRAVILLLGLFLLLNITYMIRGEMVAVTKETEEKRIALTFDDGPHPIYTAKLLEGLKERGVVATFFVTGANAKLYPELILQMREDGHTIGNHTYHHVQLSQVGEAVFLKELEETNLVLEGILQEEVQYVRPPFGEWNKSIEKEIDMFPVLWDIDPLDWCTESATKVAKRVLDQSEDNRIVLLHDGYETTIAATFQIIDTLIEEGYQFVSVDEILLQ